MQFVEPIRNKCEINKVKRVLARKENKRDLLLFLLGINSGLRISDILKLYFIIQFARKSFLLLRGRKPEAI